jgi:hypothetical protein
MTSETQRLTLRFDERAPSDAPRTLIAKLASSDPATRAAMHAFGTYERELRFYAELARETGVRTPRCHLAIRNPTTGAFLLLLDDVLGEPGIPTLAALEQTLCEIAKLHARFWNAPELHALRWLEYAPAVEAAFDQLLHGAQERMVQRIGALPEAFAETLAFASAHARDLRELERRGPRTVVHGDLHPGQVITGATGPVLFDWQTATVASPGRDLARVIAMSLPPALRALHERELIGVYHAALTHAGVRGYSLGACFDDYRRGLVASVLLNAFAVADLDEAKLRTVPCAGEPAFAAILVEYLDHALRSSDALAQLRNDLDHLAVAA